VRISTVGRTPSLYPLRAWVPGTSSSSKRALYQKVHFCTKSSIFPFFCAKFRNFAQSLGSGAPRKFRALCKIPKYFFFAFFCESTLHSLFHVSLFCECAKLDSYLRYSEYANLCLFQNKVNKTLIFCESALLEPFLNILEICTWFMLHPF